MILEILRYWYSKIFPKAKDYTKTEVVIKLIIWFTIIGLLIYSLL